MNARTYDIYRAMYVYLGYWSVCEAWGNKPGITSRTLGHRKSDHSSPHPNFTYICAWKLTDCSLETLLDIEREFLIKTAHFAYPGQIRHEIRLPGAEVRHELQMAIERALSGHSYIVVDSREYDTLTPGSEEKCIIEPFATDEEFERARVNLWPMHALPHQSESLTKIAEIYQRANIAKIYWACGLGKTAFAMMCIRTFGFARVLIGVPSQYLQAQMHRVAQEWFPNELIYLIGGDGSCNTIINIPPRAIIIAMYQSLHHIACLEFDFKIGDEAHHLCGEEASAGSRQFSRFHDIRSARTLFMTATPRETYNCRYSMDNDSFGELVSEHSVAWAIEHKKICDYSIAVVENPGATCELANAAHMSVAAMLHYNITHILICANSVSSANAISRELTSICAGMPESDRFVILTAHNQSGVDTRDIINTFISAPRAIISSVYMLGEGTDLPRLDAVVFAEKMTSEIRIVQTALRPNRIDRARPDKHAYVILPFVRTEMKDDVLPEKVEDVLARLREADECVAQRVVVLKKSGDKCVSVASGGAIHLVPGDLPIMRLVHSSNFSREYGTRKKYAHVRKFNIELGLRNKNEYHLSAARHPMYVQDPEREFAGIWMTWYAFLGVDCSRFAQTKDEWKRICAAKNIHNDVEYAHISPAFPELPPEPAEFYRDFAGIIDELDTRSRRRAG